MWGQGPGQSHNPLPAYHCNRRQFCRQAHARNGLWLCPGPSPCAVTTPRSQSQPWPCPPGPLLDATSCPPMAPAHPPGQACIASEGPKQVSMGTSGLLGTYCKRPGPWAKPGSFDEMLWAMAGRGGGWPTTAYQNHPSGTVAQIIAHPCSNPSFSFSILHLS